MGSEIIYGILNVMWIYMNYTHSVILKKCSQVKPVVSCRLHTWNYHIFMVLLSNFHPLKTCAVRRTLKKTVTQGCIQDKRCACTGDKEVIL